MDCVGLCEILWIVWDCVDCVRLCQIVSDCVGLFFRVYTDCVSGGPLDFFPFGS